MPFQQGTISSADPQHKCQNRNTKPTRSRSANHYTSVIQYQGLDAIEYQIGAGQQESNDMTTEVAYLMKEIPSLQDMVSNHTWNGFQDNVYIPNHEMGNGAFGHVCDFSVAGGLINGQVF